MLLDPHDPRCAPVAREQREAGMARWQAVSLPGDTLRDVAGRLGLTPAQVSAIKAGRRPAPRS